MRREFEWLSLLDEQDTRAEVLFLERDRNVGADGVAAVAPLDDERRLDVRLRVRPEPFRQRIGRPVRGETDGDVRAASVMGWERVKT